MHQPAIRNEPRYVVVGPRADTWAVGTMNRPLRFIYVVEYLLGGTRSFFGPPFHEALEVDGAMLAGEVDVALADALIATEEGILAHKPARVAAEEVGIACWIAERSDAVVLGGGTGPDFLKLLQEVSGILLDQRIATG